MDDLLLQIIVVCTCTFLGGFIDSISGGGGLITLPAYLAIGLPLTLRWEQTSCLPPPVHSRRPSATCGVEKSTCALQGSRA